jgi:branched-chain amino acid aminotransferase
MSEHANQRIAYYNGDYMPEGEVLLPFRDRGTRYGDAVFDMTRTFDHRPFKLPEHIKRFYQSLKAMHIEIKQSPDEMIAISEEVLKRNVHLLDQGEDYWIGQRASRGIAAIGDEGWEDVGPSVIVECMPLPLAARAALFRDGIEVMVPSVRRVPPDSLTPRAKTHNYLNLITADQEVKRQNPEAWSILLDTNGNLCEGIGSNIFIVKDGELFTPQERYVLPGVSRATVMDLAREAGLTMVEKDLDLYDAYNADEVFLTSTSLCICPVRSVNGADIADGTVPGPLTRQLTKAYASFVDCDFVAQYLAKLPVGN